MIAERCREDAIMLHMLGLREGDRKRRSHRNYFAATLGSPDDLTLIEMELAGLVRCYREPSQVMPYRLYCVTDKGKARIAATFGTFSEDD